MGDSYVSYDRADQLHNVTIFGRVRSLMLRNNILCFKTMERKCSDKKR
jgi:hypothetical protein